MTDVFEDTKGKIRDKPVSKKLIGILKSAGEIAGVDTVRIISGGQPSKKEGGKRTGSDRHDHGNAADLQLIRNKKTLSFNTDDGLDVFSAFITAAVARGATGVGAGIAYMGEYTIHVGFGSPAVWGAGGKGANAPAWLVAAVKRGREQRVMVAALDDTTPGDPDEEAAEPSNEEEVFA